MSDAIENYRDACQRFHNAIVGQMSADSHLRQLDPDAAGFAGTRDALSDAIVEIQRNAMRAVADMHLHVDDVARELGQVGAAQVVAQCERKGQAFIDQWPEVLAILRTSRLVPADPVTQESSNDRMRQAIDDDARRTSWKSADWAEFLGVGDSYVRKLPMWKTLRRP